MGMVKGLHSRENYSAGRDAEHSEYKRQVCIESLTCEKNLLRVDGSISKDTALMICLNGQPMPFQYTRRYSDVVLRDRTLSDRQAFVLVLKPGQLKKRNVVEFFQGKERLEIVIAGYQARVTELMKHSYWCFRWEESCPAPFHIGGGNPLGQNRASGGGSPKCAVRRFRKWMVVLRRTGCKIDGLQIDRVRMGRGCLREMAFLWEMAAAPYGSRKMAGIRLLYWLTRPIYRGKNIWLTFDKLYKGGDNGEYFYKYMMTRTSQGILPVYVLRKDVPDYDRLVKEGYHPSPYRSLHQRLLYLNAKLVFATHSGVHSFCGFNNWEVQFVQDRLQAVNTCIQHGLSVQDLRADSHRAVNNNQLYFCASPCEIENLSGPEYGYAPEVLRLTGIPRYDGLVSHEKKQILITPTWRSYIAMPSVMGKTRPYNPEFKNTDYYKIYQSLLEDQRLAETARSTGYRIIYLLHPVLSAQKKDFRPGEGVEILSALEADYERLLTESGLMVTDYSGVQFDFAYMRKPVIYYHPAQLPPHYEEGRFSCEAQGFGEICHEQEELVRLLCEYMESGCQIKPFYRERADAFFAYDDRDNCRRIFEEASHVSTKTVY